MTAESYGFQGIEGTLLRLLRPGGRDQRPSGHLIVESRDQSRTGARSQEAAYVGTPQVPVNTDAANRHRWATPPRSFGLLRRSATFDG